MRGGEKVAQQDYCLSAATFVVGAHAVLRDGITDVVEVPRQPRVLKEPCNDSHGNTLLTQR